MNKLKRRQFSSDEKVKILKRHLVGKEKVSDICDELKINPNQFYRWQGEFFENGAVAFERHGKQEEAKMRKFREKIDALESRIRHKDNVIATITEDYVKFKKNLLMPMCFFIRKFHLFRVMNNIFESEKQGKRWKVSNSHFGMEKEI